jgi:hypothetical protein
MKERRIIAYTLLGAVAIFLLIFWTTRGVKMPDNRSMPWQSYVNEQAQTVVFNLTMQRSLLIDAARQFGTEIEASLFERDSQKPELEVYFSSTKIGGISAKIILNLMLENQALEMLRAQVDESMLMPSGVQKTTFTPKAERLMSAFKIKSLTFIPRANLDKSVIQNLFGKPSYIDLAEKGVSYWHYPQKGLRIILNGEQQMLEFSNQKGH